MQELQFKSANFPFTTKRLRSARAIKLREGGRLRYRVLPGVSAGASEVPGNETPVSKNLDELDIGDSAIGLYLPQDFEVDLV